MTRPIVCVVNRRAGSVREMTEQQITDAIHKAAADAGGEPPKVELSSPETIRDALADARTRADEVWVGGGDGTLKTATELFLETDTTLGVLPLGTMNLLARDLGIPLDLSEAVAAISQAPIGPISIGRVNGEPFLTMSALGLYPEMVIDRERRRRLFGYGKWAAMARAAYRALRRHRTMHVRITADGEVRDVETTALIVTAAAFRFRAGRLFDRPALDSDTLTVYISHPKSRFGAVEQVARVFLGSVERDPELETMEAREVRIDFEKSRPVANDGEVDFVRAPLVYELGATKLKVRYPALSQP
ncbi:diacylglycerol kinase family protein [Fodinicurvata sp. EGI_FJ10296]|uniref:diacylglycerol/lipid kinase family protein n=1 Tax=Fodinicurvata sp. EGI_FJ10296 TaxID=3231908 RepID=UPI003453B874